jgi:hypothetical protein
MSKITYKIVKHDGGWAYEMNGTYSEKFPTREVARKAAKLAASEQVVPGDATAISFGDDKDTGTTKLLTDTIDRR